MHSLLCIVYKLFGIMQKNTCMYYPNMGYGISYSIDTLGVTGVREKYAQIGPRLLFSDPDLFRKRL